MPNGGTIDNAKQFTTGPPPTGIVAAGKPVKVTATQPVYWLHHVAHAYRVRVMVAISGVPTMTLSQPI